MAEIPVERKSGMPWWMWLVLAAAALVILFWIFADNDREAYETAAVEPVVVSPVAVPPANIDPAVGTTEPMNAAGATGPITSLAALTGAGDMTPMIGRQVNLTGVPVTEMAGDRTFFVGEGNNRLFVLLPEGQPGLPSEDSVNVNRGQTVTLNGTLRRAQDMVAGAQVEGMPANAQAVLVADSVQIASS